MIITSKVKSLFFNLLLSNLLLVICSYKILAQPVISSFSPQSAAAGATVSILGSNFNGVATSDFVFFGATQAVVTAATSTSIQVVVPAGATNQPISVTDSSAHLTGFSSTSFVPVFAGGATPSTTIAQSAVVSMGSGGVNTLFIKSVDLDGDGKPDLIASYVAGNIGLFRNTSTPGNLSSTSFGSEVDIYSGIRCTIVAITDMNGDGKPDLVTYNQDVFQLTVWQNQSVPGTISFTKAAILPDAGTTICVGDIDGDGRPDIIQMDGQQPTLLKVIQNNSVGGQLSSASFSAPVGYNGGNGIQFMAVADLDGDGKPEIITANRTDGTVTVYLNTSVPGTIDNNTLAAGVSYPAGKGPFHVAIADIDGDGKADIIVSNTDSNTFSVLKNLSTTGTINGTSFSAPVTYFSGNAPDLLDVGDLDGDGKPDIAVCNGQSGTVSIFKNTSTAGIIDQNSFAAKSDFTSSQFPYGVVIGDLDGDGKPELAVANEGAGAISIFETTINHAAPQISGFSPDSASLGQTVTITGSHLSGTSVVRFGDSLAQSFSATADTLITAVVGAGSSGKIYVTTSLGTDSAGPFTYIHPPILKSVLPLFAGKGDTILIHGNYLLSTSAVSFGGVPATSFQALSDTILIAVVSTGASGNVQVTTAFGTASSFGFIFVQPPNIYSFSPQTAGTGDTIYIHGRYLSTTKSVYFGGTSSAGFTVIADTLLLVKIGSGSSGDILLDNIGDTVSVPGFTFNGSVVVNAFSPATGPLGTSVQITGNNFDPIPGNDIVYFGAVRASIVAASPNVLTAIVPAGANMLPISVTARGTTAYAQNPFVVTFSSQDTGFDASSFDTEQVIATDVNPYCASVVDVDGDGKPDLTVGFNSGALGSTSLSILQNTGSTGAISFSQGGKYSTDPSDASIQIAPTDLDGDGKIDLAISNGSDGNAVSIFQNTSVPGNSQLSNFQLLNQGGPGGFHIATGDLDGDGRPDIVVTSDYYPGAHIYRNISSGQHIEYSFVGYYPVSGYSSAVVISDLNGDGKADIAVATGNYLSVFRNTSTVGTISLDVAQQFVIQTGYNQQISLAVADLNQDGKPDLVTTSSSSLNMVSIFQNNSSGPVISFAARQDLPFTGFPGSVTLADFNGDGKPDIAVLNGATTPSISVFKNTTSGGNISMAAPFSIPIASGAGTISSGDLDGDGKPEIIVVKAQPNSISIFRNLAGSGVPPVINSFSPVSGKQGDTITILGDHLTGALSVNFGGTPASSIVTNSDTLIKAIVGNGSTGKVEVSTPMGMASLPGFEYLRLKLNSFSPDSLHAGGLVTILGNHLSGSTSVWFGNVPAQSFSVISDSVITATVGTGASGYVKVISPLGTDSLAGFVFLLNFPHIYSFTPTRGDSGTIVTIKGIYLTGATSVNFGGMAATSFAVVSDSVITAVAGKGVSGYVSVYTATGVDSLSGFIFNAPAAPKPILLSFNPASGSTDSVITITGKNLIGTTAVDFGATAAASFTVVSDSMLKAVVARGASGYVSVFTPAGADSLPGFIFNVPVVIVPHMSSFSPGSGSTDSVITILGKNLMGVTIVNFGGTAAASFTIVSDSVIKAVVARGASGYVSVFSTTGRDSLPGFVFNSPAAIEPKMLSFSPASGSTDSVITILGNHLNSVTTVDFGGTAAASFTVVSDSVITAVVGMGASGYVAVFTPAGADSLSGFIFDTPSIALPQILSFSPTSGSTDSVITIHGKDLSGVTVVSFGGTNAASFHVVSDSVVTAVVGTGSSGAVAVKTANQQDSLPGFLFIPPAVDSSAFVFKQLIVVDTSGHIGIAWSVNNDKSIVQYTVQRGSDSISFSDLSTLPSVQQNGLQQYSTSDGQPMIGMNYYRIQMTDTSGHLTYSYFVGVDYLSNTIQLYPNPATRYIMVVNPAISSMSVIRVIEGSGKIMREIQLPANQTITRVDLTGILPGVYTLSWTDGYLHSIARQFIIQQ